MKGRSGAPPSYTWDLSSSWEHIASLLLTEFRNKHLSILIAGWSPKPYLHITLNRLTIYDVAVWHGVED